MSYRTSSNHFVFYQSKKIKNKGRFRYKFDSARVEKYPVTQDFAYAVCDLPNEYNEAKYREFIDSWGTVSSPGLNTSHNAFKNNPPN